MTCADLSERMPAVALGRSRWTEAEAAHLQGCMECRREWAVVSAGAAVGAGAPVDADAVAARVVARLRAEPRVRSLRPLGWVAGLAAAAALLLFVVPRRGPVTPAQAEAEFVVEVPGLGGLADDGLAEVLETLDADWTGMSTNDVPSLEDLDAGGLRQIDLSLES